MRSNEEMGTKMDTKNYRWIHQYDGSKKGKKIYPEEAIKRLKTEGEKKGIAKEKIEIAEKMKKEGCSKELIERVTGILL